MLRPEYNIDDPFIYNTNTVDYVTFVKLIYNSVTHYTQRFYKVRPDYAIPWTFFEDLKSLQVTAVEVFWVILLAFFWTILRTWVTDTICKPLIQKLDISPLNHKKFPESVWKLLYYSTTFGFSLYVHIFSNRYDYFYNPLSLWKGWQTMEGQTVYWDIYFIYVSQCSFYLHSIYATWEMDTWKKDSTLMMVHHFVALALITLSYGSGHMLEGAFVLFLHDNTDMMLEITKLCMYLRKRENGDYYPFYHWFGNTAFFLFAVMWVVFRLYWYPLKLLYTAFMGVYLGPQDGPFFGLLGAGLVIIAFMNVYWFTFILTMLIRVLRTGKEPEDNRELNSASAIEITRKLERLAKEGKITKQGKVKLS
uniref:TLC domain-containing protein n=1 Tax=Rhabditophanes sp. KR3021 TaxID=114890 RepID=A0AC35U229_9BILA